VRLAFAGDAIRQARIALGGAAASPIRAASAEGVLEGSSLTAESIAAAASAAAAESDPPDDANASAWYRRRMIEVQLRRALEAWPKNSPSG
jgi:CO/xanthine dehydrogenase FAD-binding subunit